MKKQFGVELKIVDQDPKFKARLKIWNRNGTAASFNPVQGVMFIRKKVTPYTIQHEMFHMKLWHKMTKEFPDLNGIYQKTIGNKIFHEEYVLSQFLSGTKKWGQAEILIDLTEINKLRFRKGLDPVDLNYFKNWKLEDELSKIVNS